LFSKNKVGRIDPPGRRRPDVSGRVSTRALGMHFTRFKGRPRGFVIGTLRQSNPDLIPVTAASVTDGRWYMFYFSKGAAKDLVLLLEPRQNQYGQRSTAFRITGKGRGNVPDERYRTLKSEERRPIFSVYNVRTSVQRQDPRVSSNLGTACYLLTRSAPMDRSVTWFCRAVLWELEHR